MQRGMGLWLAAPLLSPTNPGSCESGRLASNMLPRGPYPGIWLRCCFFYEINCESLQQQVCPSVQEPLFSSICRSEHWTLCVRQLLSPDQQLHPGF